MKAEMSSCCGKTVLLNSNSCKEDYLNTKLTVYTSSMMISLNFIICL